MLLAIFCNNFIHVLSMQKLYIKLRFNDSILFELARLETEREAARLAKYCEILAILWIKYACILTGVHQVLLPCWIFGLARPETEREAARLAKATILVICQYVNKNAWFWDNSTEIPFKNPLYILKFFRHVGENCEKYTTYPEL
jgi:hypothetical protein